MKYLILLFILFCSTGLFGQYAASVENAKSEIKSSNLFNKFTYTATVGTGYYQNNFKQLGRVSFGEWSIQYKANTRLSFGLGVLGSLLCDATVLDNEGNPVALDDDDDEDEDDEGDMDEPDDTDDDDCNDDFELGNNLMGVLTYQLSEYLPLFIRSGAGYSFNVKAPVYSVMLGYNQNIIAGLGLTAGIRYSDIIETKSTPNFVSTVGGLKAEVGLSWNF